MFGRDDVEGSCRTHIDDNGRGSIQCSSRESVGEPVLTNTCWIRVADGQVAAGFVSESKDLAEVLQREDHGSTLDRDHKAFFFLDSELSRWKKLLLQ